MIKIYDTDLNPLCVITGNVSIQFIKRFYDMGSFEIHFPINCKFLEYLQEDNYIYANGNFGIIGYKYASPTDIKICGYDLNGLLYFRKVEGNKTGNFETVIKNYVSENLMTGDRLVSKFRVATNQNRGASITSNILLSKLDIEIKKLCELNFIGYDITKINNELVFDIIVPTDRTQDVIFSKTYKSISDFEYTKDNLTSINTVYNNDETATTLIAKEVFTGIKRKEGIATAKEDIQNNAYNIIASNGIKESIEAEANSKLVYKTDWNLGDYVTVIVDVFGERLSLQKQITEVQEVYERGNVSIKPTFGNKKESIIKKLIRG